MRFLLILMMATFLSSCKLQPLYFYEKLTWSEELSSIMIGDSLSINESNLNYHLHRILPLTKEAKYILQASMAISSSSFVNQKSDIFIYTIKGNVKYQLLSKVDNNLITQGRFNTISSYNVNNSPYATNEEKESAEFNLAKQAAEDIRKRLLLFLTKYNA